VARKREFDDDDVVRAVRDVFWQRGYTATSISDLEKATGLNRSSLYSTYGSKRELFARATANYLSEFIQPMFAPLEAAGAGPKELAGYFLGLADFFRRTADCNASPGCFILNSAVDLNALDEEAAEQVRRQRARTKAAFLHALSSLGDRVPDPDARAELLTVAQVGVIMISRTDADAAVRLAELQAREIESW
jgi:AcrR family transcriptional regulator